jgi:hypothetical protein
VTRPRASTVHAAAVVAWTVSIGPTLLWWSNSILWLIFISLWANIVAHASAYESARAKELVREQGDGDS